MLTAAQINEIHRLHWAEHWSVRKIARHLRIGRRTIASRLSFDGNRYCVPQRYVGRRLMVKADSSSVAIYDRVNEVVSYARSWRRGQTFGAERFAVGGGDAPRVQRQRWAGRVARRLPGWRPE